MSAVFVNDLKYKRTTNFAFDMNSIANIHGESGIYLQYTHVRVCSIEKMAGFEIDPTMEIDYSALDHIKWVRLMTLTWGFEAVLRRVDDSLEPSILLDYLFALR